MKKYITILPLMLLAFLLLPLTAVAVPVNLEVNGKPISVDIAAYSENGRTMVPIRFVMDELQATVNWDSASNTATIYKGGVILELHPNSTEIKINGISSQMDTPAAAKEGRIFVPVRFVAEFFNAQVNWNQETQSVQIYFSADSGFKILGYYYDADSFTCYNDFAKDFDMIAHFNYSLTEDGHVKARSMSTPDRYNEIKTNAQYPGQDKLLLVTGFYAYIVDGIVGDAGKRASVIADLLMLMQQGGYNGIDLDIEAMSDSSKTNLVLFVQELKAAMGTNKILSMSLTPKVSDKQFWLNKYDYASLAATCDQIILMFYNQHYSGSSAGSNCGIDWLEQGIQYMLQYIPKEKMIIGLGVYGYDWKTNETGTVGSSVRIATAIERAALYGSEILRDETSGTPYYKYYKLVNKDIEIFDGYYINKEQGKILTDTNGENYTVIETISVPATHWQTVQVYESHEVWFEDEISMAQKAALIRGYDVRGIALWRMGFMPNTVVDSILAQSK